MLPEAYELRRALAVLAMHGNRMLRAGRRGDAPAAARHRADLDAQVPAVLALAGERDRRRGRWRLAGGLEAFLKSVRAYAAAGSEEERASFFELLGEIYGPADAGGEAMANAVVDLDRAGDVTIIGPPCCCPPPFRAEVSGWAVAQPVRRRVTHRLRVRPADAGQNRSCLSRRTEECRVRGLKNNRRGNSPAVVCERFGLTGYQPRPP
jgi:hypothetical protein